MQSACVKLSTRVWEISIIARRPFQFWTFRRCNRGLRGSSRRLGMEMVSNSAQNSQWKTLAFVFNIYRRRYTTLHCFAGYYLFSAIVRFQSPAGYVRLMIGVDDAPSFVDGAHAISGLPSTDFFTITLETTRYVDKNQKARASRGTGRYFGDRFRIVILRWSGQLLSTHYWQIFTLSRSSYIWDGENNEEYRVPNHWTTTLLPHAGIAFSFLRWFRHIPSPVRIWLLWAPWAQWKTLGEFLPLYFVLQTPPTTGYDNSQRKGLGCS